jgi:16S rRNA (adenine1518-N6/adenine1519-N6)-dimethyltransferase
MSDITLLGAQDIRALANEIDVSPTKKWGQNFVIDPNTVRRIVDTAQVAANDVVLEVGPGLGSLTLAILEKATKVVVIEIDSRLADKLPQTIAQFAPSRVVDVSIVQADALTVTELPISPTKLVANLPYNVSVPVVLHLLETFPSINEVLVMVQAEVADRLAATPGSKIYGVPSVKASWYGVTSRAGAIGRNVFWPAPNVDSGLVRIVRGTPPGDEQLRKEVFAIVDSAFGQRRKTLRSSLAAALGSSARIDDVLQRAQIDSGLRGEQLDLADFVAIAKAAKVQ